MNFTSPAMALAILDFAGLIACISEYRCNGCVDRRPQRHITHNDWNVVHHVSFMFVIDSMSDLCEGVQGWQGVDSDDRGRVVWGNCVVP